MQVRLLGPVDVLVGETSRPVRGLRRKAVLALLALHRGQVVSTDRLLEVVWGDDAPPTVLNTLQSNISHLRQVLGRREAIASRPPGYVLELDPPATDAALAEHLIEQAARAAHHTDRVRHLRAALELWRGRSLVDVAELDWFAAEGDRLDQLRLRAVRALAESRIALGEHLEVLPELEQLTREHPFDEQLHGNLILALYRAGRQAESLAAFRRLRDALDEELGIEPGPALRDLETAILRQDPELSPAPPVALPAPAASVQLGGPAVVGRQEEMAALLELVRGVTAGAGGAVFLIGEAGIGKTRLAAEVSRSAADAGLLVLRGRAAAPAVQFRPLSEALLALLRRSGPPDAAELRPYLPALSRLVPEWRREHGPEADESLIVLAEAVLRLIVHLGGPAGVLMVLEDLHEADADTLAVVDYLIDNAGQAQLLVLATLRPDPCDAMKVARGAQHRRAAGVIELRRLADDAVRELALGCLAADDIPEPVVERLRGAADGVPLHVEELLVGMVGDGVLTRRDGYWTLTGPLPSGPPTTLAATLTGRADRLGARTRELLRAAALLGRRFPAVAAGAVAEMDEDELVSGLREAIEAQLLVADDTTGEYAFRHALTAEALRDRMLPFERSVLSRRAAEAVEAARPAGGEWLAGELWVTAGDPHRAADRFAAAAARAAEQGAVATQICLLERSVSLVEPSIEVVEALIDAYAIAGRVDDAYALGARARGYADPARRAALHLRLARVAAAAGHWNRGLREASRARRLLSGRDDPALTARIDVVAARLVFGNPTRGRYRAAERLAGRALTGARAAGRPDVACQALEVLGRCARRRDLAEADLLYEQGLAIAEEHHLVGERIGLLYNLGGHDGVRSADPHRLRAALDQAVRAGAVVSALNIELELAVVQTCRGEYDEARAATERCEETARRLRLTHTRLIALGERVIVAAHQGRPDEVDRLLERFHELGGEDDDFASAVRGFGLTVGYLVAGQPGRALDEVRRSAAAEAQHPASYISFAAGPALLLTVLDGTAGEAECAAMTASANAQAGWNRQFLLLSRAVLDGRAGRPADARAAYARFQRMCRPYPLIRLLGPRLVAPAAAEDGWSDSL
jgi:DNA-binding SARP family transcriptional activator